ncbi:MAG: glycerol-3-phosphate acyltransferase [Bacteroidetes bacterium]|nr:glycerol-3-phosphate acyltransferase [Bacteroidota bacterium]
MTDYIVSLCISYFIGSIPTAYLVVKRTSDVDIRTAGSGNVGGRNALEVTGKKWVGVIVTLGDLLKGVIAVVLAAAFFDSSAAAVSAAMFGTVLGHCYPVWLKFHGGRGLATGAGSLFVTSWPWVFVWLGLYFGSERFTKNVHASSVIALVGLPLLMWAIPDSWLTAVIPSYFTTAEFFTAGSMIVAVCLSRHIEPIKEYYEAKND